MKKMRTTANPPLYARIVLPLLYPHSKLETIYCDLEEEFELIAVKYNIVLAKTWYLVQVVKILNGKVYNDLLWSVPMVKNYVRIAFRNIYRHIGFSTINIFGLTVGMTCSILIILWVQDELSYDRFNKNADRIYRVVKYSDYDGHILHVALTPGPLPGAMKKELPEVEEAVSFTYVGGIAKYKNNYFNHVRSAATESGFFTLFSYPFIQGNPEIALADKNSIVLTERFASKVFGTEDPMGKIITFQNTYDYKVTGILKNIPKHSHLQFDCIIPFKKLLDFGNTSVTSWKPNSFYTYVLLDEGVSENELNKKIVNFKQKHYSQCRDFLYLQPLTKIHLYSNLGYDVAGHGDIKYVVIFALVAGFILLIACINYMNLTTALASKRAIEVGMRKVIGATKSTLRHQFFSESLIMSFLAFLFASLLVTLLLPFFNQLSGKELTLITHDSSTLFYGMFLFVLIIGLLSGSYPAMIMSSFQPVKVFKGGMLIGRKSALFRKVLVLIQFSLSVFLLICTFTVSKQIIFIKEMKLGFEKEHLVYAYLPFMYDSKYESLKNELLQDGAITHVTRMRTLPTSDFVNSYTDINWTGKNAESKVLFAIHDVGYDFFDAFSMQLIQGRGFSSDFPSDRNAYVLNEKAVEVTGLKKPLGTTFSQGDRSGPIIGVVKDFYFKSLQNEIEPLIFRLPVNPARNVFIKISATNVGETMKRIINTWKKIVPDFPCEFQFLDEDYDNLYRTENRTVKLFSYFSALAICITGLGLAGLATFVAELRRKEIGIRKILGATTPKVILLLSKESIIYILFANIIAWPLAYLAMNNWLANYAYHTTLSFQLFLISSLFAVFIAIFSVGYQTIKAATANPVANLKYE